MSTGQEILPHVLQFQLAKFRFPRIELKRLPTVMLLPVVTRVFKLRERRRREQTYVCETKAAIQIKMPNTCAMFGLPFSILLRRRYHTFNQEGDA